MKSLFAKIMTAQAATVVLALLVVMALTRLSLDRGFIDFVERQESGVLSHLAPLVAEVYSAHGGWDFLRDDPENWPRILRRSRQLDARPGPGWRPPISRGDPEHATSGHPSVARADGGLHWLRTFDRIGLRERLFLLDENREPLAGGHAGHWLEHRSDPGLEPVVVEGATVGWIGFTPVRRGRPAEVQRFLHGQLRAHSVALVVALALVAVLAYALARHLSQPVASLDQTVNELSRGEFGKRAIVSSRDEIGRLARNVNRLAETLERNRSARHRWMTDIAHELRTPVAILKGEIEALRDGLRPPDQTTFGSLGEEIDHLSRLVDDLQSLALADAGALSLQRRRIDLRELVQQAADAYRERLSGRHIRLELTAPDGVRANADPQRIRQLLNNLLENCWRYVSDGGRVHIQLKRHQEGAVVTVEDSGPGVSPDALPLLFERFYRGERRHARAGSGLGLSICRGIAEAHGGSIEARHSELGGLAVRLTLPA